MSINGFKIEKGIAAPPVGKVGPKFPFREMQIGDSFAVSIEDWKNTTSSASAFGKYHNQKFTVRKHGDAYRCWRLA